MAHVETVDELPVEAATLLEMVKATYPDLPEWFAETVVEWYAKRKADGCTEDDLIASLKASKDINEEIRKITQDFCGVKTEDEAPGS